MAKVTKKVVWPAYIDAHKTRKEGRILAKGDCVAAPDIKEMLRAAEELKLSPIYEDEKAYPRLWWEHTGRLLVDVNGAKREAIRQIARVIKASRVRTILEHK
jgi:signal recognition particle subunit SRP19